VGGIGRHSGRTVELAVATAEGAPLGQVGARAGELLNAIVVGVRDVDVAGTVGRHSAGKAELPVAAAFRTPLGEVDGRLCSDGRGKNGCDAKEGERDPET